jgi:NAD(P)-dependent dehydrogenase (short-subunit alcohol dehydrogenase family)
MLGEQGATVYCSGRSTRGNLSPIQRPETIDETAEMVTKYGGVGIPVQTDHHDQAQVKALVDRIEREHGKLDILVNDVWGGERLISFKSFLESSLENGFEMLRTAINTHLITSYYAAPLMIKNKSGLIVEVTDGDTLRYRGMLVYDLAKVSVMRLAFSQSVEFRPHNIAVVAVTPGFLRSEQMLEEAFGVTEENWKDAVKKEPNFIASETPFFVGRAVAHLAMDANIMSKTGRAFSSWGLSDEYGFTDINGERPHWERHLESVGGWETLNMPMWEL